MRASLILAVNLLGSTLVFWVAARLYILPKLQAFKPQRILLPILLLHSTRHLGLMFLSPGATYPGIVPQFAYPAGLGDLLAAVLAFAAIPAVAKDLTATEKAKKNPAISPQPSAVKNVKAKSKLLTVAINPPADARRWAAFLVQILPLQTPVAAVARA